MSLKTFISDLLTSQTSSKMIQFMRLWYFEHEYVAISIYRWTRRLNWDPKPHLHPLFECRDSKGSGIYVQMRSIV